MSLRRAAGTSQAARRAQRGLLIRYRSVRSRLPGTFRLSGGNLLAVGLALATAGYVAWKTVQSPDLALQFAFNGLSVGAIYALLAMGFTVVYSTVWFFDLYFGARRGDRRLWRLLSQVHTVLARPVRLQQPLRQYHLRGGRRRGGRVGPPHRPLCPAPHPLQPDRSSRGRGPPGGRKRSIRRARAGQSRRAQPNAQSRGRPARRGSRGVGALPRLLRHMAARQPRPSLGALRAPGDGPGSLRRPPHGQLPGVQPLPELGGVVPAGGSRRHRPLPGPIRVHARTGEVSPGHAGRVPRRPAGHHGPHNHRLPERAAPPPGGLRQRALDHWRGQHQGVQHLHHRRRRHRLHRPAAPTEEDILREGREGHRRRRRGLQGGGNRTRPSSSPSYSSSAPSTPPWRAC